MPFENICIAIYDWLFSICICGSTINNNNDDMDLKETNIEMNCIERRVIQNKEIEIIANFI